MRQGTYVYRALAAVLTISSLAMDIAVQQTINVGSDVVPRMKPVSIKAKELAAQKIGGVECHAVRRARIVFAAQGVAAQQPDIAEITVVMNLSTVKTMNFMAHPIVWMERLRLDQHQYLALVHHRAAPRV